MELVLIILLIGLGVYWHRRRKRNALPLHARGAMSFLDDKLDELAYQLHEEMIKSEKMAQITYLQWKIDQERNKRITLTTGVILPHSQWREEQDRVFATLEHSMEQKRQLFLAAHKREAEKADKVAEMERKTAEAVSKALGDDLK